jgi:hypothetical protein
MRPIPSLHFTFLVRAITAGLLAMLVTGLSAQTWQCREAWLQTHRDESLSAVMALLGLCWDDVAVLSDARVHSDHGCTLI